MVKAGRKTLSCPRRQVQNQMEEDDEDIQPQEDTQSPSQPQPEGRAQSPGQPQLQAQASDEASPPDEKQGGETPMETDAQNQEAEEDCPSRSRPPAARALWKPIPQIQPQPAGQWKPIPPLEPQNSPGEPASATSASGSTRNQSCQTEEQPPQSSPGGHAHSLGYCIEPGDPPLFQQPLQTSKSGIQQIIECFRSGTSELKHMLLREVDTIFECKLCRSLFRGLPNLITHKEYYCLRRMPETDGDDRQSVAIRDLLEAIYPRKDRPEHVMRLEPIETSNKAVFQYLSTEDELNRYPAHTASNRQSPVAWDLEEGGSEPQQQQGQQGPSEGPGSSFQSSQSYGQAQRRREAPDEEAPEEAMQAEEDGSTSGVDDVTISCCLCGKDFNSRRSIRRHCRKEHQTKLEELRKFTETRTVPTSLLSLVKGRPRTLTTPTGKSCPVCYKNFATKANVRRHFDEVHRGLRRDTITPEIATRPGQLLTLEATPPKKPAAANPSPTRCTTPKSSTPVSSKGTPQGPNKGSGSGSGSGAAAAAAAPTAPYNLATCRCLLCKRTYSSQVMLKRHMGIVHKMYNLKNGAPVAAATSPSQPPNNGSGAIGEGVRVKQEVEESSDDNDDEEEEEDEEEDTESSSSASASASDRADTPPRKGAATSPGPEAAAPTKGPTKGVKVKTEEQAPPLSPKSSSASSSSSPPPPAPRSAATTTTTTTTTTTKAPKLSVGFDFKQLFCKLCKRQFSSRQNLTKHIELHTDGTDIFIKFYRCPLCRYESRRKRDVLRHVTVVHKKSSSYLAKIMPNLESRAVKRSAESVLNNSSLAKKISTAVAAATSSGGGGGGAKKEVNGRNASSSSGPPSPPSPPVTRKQDQQSSSSSSGGATSSGAAPATTTSSSSTSSTSSTAPSSSKAFAPSPPVTRKQERQQQRQRSCSPPLTRRSDKFSSAAAAHARRNEAESGESHSSEVKVTKNFSLHACDQCGRAFAKKLYLESHKRSHRNAAAAATENRRKGINTRSKSLLW